MSLSAPTGVSAPRANISGYKLRNVPNMSPEVMQLFSKLLGGTSGVGIDQGLKSQQGLAAGDEDAFKRLEAPAYTAFNKQLGNIGSRFAGVGALDSSAFQNATSGAAQSFAENLGAQRHGIQEGALDRLLGLSDRLLSQKPYDSFLEKKRSGFDTAGDISSLLAKILPLFL